MECKNGKCYSFDSRFADPEEKEALIKNVRKLLTPAGSPFAGEQKTCFTPRAHKNYCEEGEEKERVTSRYLNRAEVLNRTKNRLPVPGNRNAHVRGSHYFFTTKY